MKQWAVINSISPIRICPADLIKQISVTAPPASPQLINRQLCTTTANRSAEHNNAKHDTVKHSNIKLRPAVNTTLTSF